MNKNKRIFLSSPTMHKEEQEFIKKAFDSNYIAPIGENIDCFEHEIAQYLGIKYTTALSSCTAALHLAVKLAGVKRNDIVFCSDLTFAATANPVSYEGGKQVFIDCEEQTWNMNPQALEKAFKKYPSCKCVISANLYGTPGKLDEIRAICDFHHAIFIEDAAESLSASYNGQQTGTFGHYNAISFNGNKIITASGGGMLLSNDEDAIKKARFWSTQSKEQSPWYEHNEIGYNYRMSNIVAGIGRGQLLHIKQHHALKKKIYETYKAAFKDIDAISMNPYLPCSEPNFWISCIILNQKMCHTKPSKIIAALENANIECRHIWKPMHMQPVFSDCDFIKLFNDSPSISESIFENGICLPSDIKNTDEDMKKIIGIILDEVYKKVKLL